MKATLALPAALFISLLAVNTASAQRPRKTYEALKYQTVERVAPTGGITPGPVQDPKPRGVYDYMRRTALATPVRKAAYIG